MSHRQTLRTAGVLFVLAWGFWLHRWAPALLVVTFVVWVILHNRLEAGLGDVLHRQWLRGWPGTLALIALLSVSALGFVFYDAPAKAKIVPVGLDILALSMILFGRWWTLVALPRWLGGPAPLLVRLSAAPTPSGR